LSLTDYTVSNDNGVLDLHTGSGDFSLSFAGDSSSTNSPNYTLANFAVSPDAHDGMQITEVPAISVDGLQTSSDDSGHTTVTGIAVLEPFAGSDALTLSLVPDTGSLALNDTTDLTTNSGGPSGSVSVTGTLAELDNALSHGVVYTNPDGDLPDSGMVALTVGDGHGGTDSLNFVFTIADTTGNFTLAGTSGNDVIFSSGASGHTETLTGNGGSDTFVFDHADLGGQDIISDFNTTTDTLHFDSSIFSTVSDVLASAQDDAHGNTVLDLHNGDSITLNHVAYSQFEAINHGHIVIA
jgi:hypothetical protein